MPIWRVTLKKIRFFAKGSAASSNSLGKHLPRYMDKAGKKFASLGGGTEARCLLPDDESGKIYTGGFLGDSSSPGSAERDKQLEWCRRIAKKWDKLLQPRSRRRSDGFRWVLSLGPHAVDDLKVNGISTDMALRNIWRQTMALYQRRHKWNTCKGELAWLCGGHHDPDDARLHIILFPTTRDGYPLYTNTKQSANLTEHLQTELIAMANIATEMYWREHLGIEYQTQEYQERLRMFPESEPPLPGLNDYVRNRKPRTLRDKRPAKPKFDLRLVTKNTLEDTAWQLGQKMTLKKLPGKGLRHLTGRIMTQQVFKGLATPMWKVILYIIKTPRNFSNLLIAKFPDENGALTTLHESLAKSSNKAARQLATQWADDPEQRTWSLLELALGVGQNLPPKLAHDLGIELAQRFETIPTSSNKPEHLDSGWKFRQKWNELSTQTGIRHNRYRAARRVISVKLGPQSQEAKILSKLIRGAELLTDDFESRREEIEAIIQKTGDKLALRTEDRDWSLDNGEMVLKPGSGAPWPAHYDATTVFQPLKSAATTEPIVERTRDAAELKLAMANLKPDQEAMLCRMIRVFTPRRTQRMQDSMKITEPEIK